MSNVRIAGSSVARRLGLFVHWGLYAIPAWHEQILWRRPSMTREAYERLTHRFNPDRFDPDQWVEIAQAAGMQYLIFTAKHHDGFCMFDSRHTSYKVTNTPYGKDVLAQLAEACARKNMALSIYYSLPDWRHPDYPNQGRHHQMFGPRSGEEQNRERYYAYVKEQITELMTGYGPIYQLFWDINVDEWDDGSINEYVRSLQPDILINDRGPDEGDYTTPERYIPEGKAFSRPTEGISSFGRESWGYRAEEDWYSDKFLIQSIDKVLAMGGNYALNVGPKADGSFPEENLRSLARIGDWYARVGESFAGAAPASYLVERDEMPVEDGKHFIVRDEVWVTRKGNTLYVHLPREPQSTAVLLKPIRRMPREAVLLNDGRHLEACVDVVPWHWQEPPWLRVRGLPVNEITGEVMVLRLKFDEEDGMDSGWEGPVDAE